MANLAQREYWDSVAGPKWVRLAATLEPRLERINALLLERARPAPGERVLEIGSGLGTTTLPLARAVGPSGDILGVDIAEPMIAASRERVLASGLRNITLELADAQTHSFASEAFELVTSRFGVMFFEHPVAAFANVLKAMRTGGRLCFVCWGPMADNPHWQLPFDIAVRRLGPPAPRPAHAPGPLAFSDKTYVESVLVEAGFEEISVEPVGCDLPGVSAVQEADMACEMGPPGSLVNEHQPEPDMLAMLKSDFAAAFAPYESGNTINLPAGLLIVQASKQ